MGREGSKAPCVFAHLGGAWLREKLTWKAVRSRSPHAPRWLLIHLCGDARRGPTPANTGQA